MKPRALLTTGNPKVAKGEGYGYLTAILHLAPHNLSGHNVCPMATAECSAMCLESAGRGGIYAKADTRTLTVADGRRIRTNTIRRARIARTLFMFDDTDAFFAQLAREIRAHVRRAHRYGLIPAVRLNGTSDIRWEDIPTGQGGNIFQVFPDVQFYDYTKIPGRHLPFNYRLTFSFSGHNLQDSLATLASGGNVAVVFNTRKGHALPRYWYGYSVIDGDVSDLRFLDPKYSVVGLRAKGKAKKAKVGSFVQDATAA